MSKAIRLLPSFLTVGSWTMLSRVLGLARDILLAALLGTGPVAQAFLVAFTLPNMFRRFFAEGAFNLAFVPMFAKRVEAGEGAEEFAQDAFSGLGAILIVFTLIGQLLMPWLVLAMASGFLGDERYDLSVSFGRIAFPYVLLISLTAMMSGVLNSLGRFAIAAAAPTMLNVVMIAFLLAGHWSQGALGQWLIWSVPVAGVAQFVLVWYGAAKAGIRLIPRMPRMTPELKRLLAIAAPAVLSGGVLQINLLVGRQVGSFFDGAVAWLSYADRLYQLPLGVVGIAIGVVLLPDLARRLRANDTKGAREATNRAAEFTLALTLPAAFALIVIPVPIVSVLFQRGEFDLADTSATALAVAIYAAGLPAFVLQKILLPAYYVREDTRTPLRYTIYSMVINAALAIGLAPFIGFIAAAFGTTIAGWVMVLQLWRGTRTMGDATTPDARLRRTVPKVLAACTGMSLVLVAIYNVMDGLLTDALLRYPALAVLIASGAVAYGALILGTGAISKSDIRGAFRRSGK